MVLVFRGGCWFYFDLVPSGVRAGYRFRFTVSYRHSDVGFRCVRE